MATITISRESGSGGGDIARLLAKALGYHLVDRKLIRSLLEQYGVLEFDDVYDAAPGFKARFVDRRGEVTEMMNRVLLAVARHGDSVILGRGGYAALRGLGDVLSVRVQAPLAVRARRLVARGEARTLDEAQDQASDRDKRRAAFVEFSYGGRWDAASDFDLVLDTGKMPPELAVALVARASQGARPEEGAGLTSSLEVDPVMADAVAEALGCRNPHARFAGEAVPQAPA